MMTISGRLQAKRVVVVSPFNWLYAYMGYIMITSLVGWAAALISELKAILFMGVNSRPDPKSVRSRLDRGRHCRMVRAAMLVVATSISFGSVMTIPFPTIGQSMILMERRWLGESVDLSQSTGCSRASRGTRRP
jgi:hypothetical protein